MPYAPANAFVLAGLEGTRGTLSSNLKDIPVLGPQLTPIQKWIKDEGLRGSPVKTYDNVLGVTGLEWSTKLNVFADTFPIFVRGALGAADTKVAAPTSTTLSGSGNTAASTSITTVASIAAGSAIIIGTVGGIFETHITGTPTGSGPYTIPITTPLMNSYAAGVTVAGLTSHLFQLQNDQVGSQPPSVSFQDFDGGNAYQALACQLQELTLTHGAEKALEAEVKFIGNPYTSASTPSLTVGSEHFIPSWFAENMIGGSQVTVLEEGSISIKRDATASIYTENGVGGIASPHSNFAGPAVVTGKDTFCVESGDSTLVEAMTYDKLAVVREFTDPETGHMIHIQTSRTQFMNPKRDRNSKWYLRVDAEWEAEGNTTDAATGYSPIEIIVANAVTTTY